MCARLSDLSLLENHDAICVLNGGESMGDDDGSSTLSSLVEGFLYDALAADVNGARCFVEDEDGTLLTMDRAIARCWRWPPESPAPPSPTLVSYP